MSIESLAVVIAALLVGTLGKAITGFGLPLFAVPAMAAFIDVQTAVVVMVLPSTLSNVWADVDLPAQRGGDSRSVGGASAAALRV